MRPCPGRRAPASLSSTPPLRRTMSSLRHRRRVRSSRRSARGHGIGQRQFHHRQRRCRHGFHVDQRPLLPAVGLEQHGHGSRLPHRQHRQRLPTAALLSADDGGSWNPDLELQLHRRIGRREDRPGEHTLLNVGWRKPHGHRVSVRSGQRRANDRRSVRSPSPSPPTTASRPGTSP